MSYPTERNMSAQAWRRLWKCMSAGELEDLAKDLSALARLSEEEEAELVFALTGFNWEAQKQL